MPAKEGGRHNSDSEDKHPSADRANSYDDPDITLISADCNTVMRV